MSINYEWRWCIDENGEATDDAQCCDCCGSDVPVYNFKYMTPERRFDPRFLCELCSATCAGTAHEYTQQYSYEIRGVLETINYAANAVLSELGKFGQRPEATTND